ncbi:hypothetical protein QQZ08_011751 [Neonectria magnoliae]|uniref:ORC1/DEAH AAA+ ATPase domain-containing protein n=1 Tax=Neonectria magnoliae TaxID=2732573 RepID=A0ABR1H871_9HYPO
MDDRVSYGRIDGGNVFTGVNASGSATQNFNFHNSSPNPIPPPCHVIAYHRNGDFVGRPDITDKLERLLSPTSDGDHTAALFGLGGSGKTQIALEYAYRQSRDSCCSVFWVHADNETTFIHDYKTIAMKLGLSRKLDGEDLLQAVKNGIEEKQQWLLIIDNADDLALFGVKPTSDQPISNFLEHVPKGPYGTVLWTTRDSRIAGTLVAPRRGLSVSGMTVEEAQRLLESAMDSTIGGEELQGARELLQELQWFPLAISQAGAYMRKTRTSIEEYSSMLTIRKMRWRILKQTEFDRHRRSDAPNSVLETWSISIQQIKKENGMAYRILHTVAYVDNQNIPLELLVAAGTFSNRKKRKQSRRDEEEAARAISRLQEFSFITAQKTEPGNKTFEMHKLVQEASRYGLYIKSRREGDGRGARGQLSKTAYARDEGYFASAGLEIMTEMFPEVSIDSEEWPRCERYLAHAMRVCEWADVCGKKEVSDLLRQVGRYMNIRGRWDAAATAHKRALGLRREVLGNDHPKSIGSLLDVGWVFYRQRRYRESEEAACEALGLARKVLGDKHWLTLKCRCLLSLVFLDQKRLDEAEDMAVEALRCAREEYGQKSTPTMYCLHVLTHVQVAQGQFDKAQEAQLDMLEFRRHHDGERHWRTGEAHFVLGNSDYDREQWDKAEEHYTKALGIYRGRLDDDHPDTLTAMHNLALVWRKQGRALEAIAQMKECSQMRHRVLGPDHPHTKGADGWIENFANADAIRLCPTCKHSFTNAFHMPQLWWTPYSRNSNGYFGCETERDDNGNTASLRRANWYPDAWSRFLVKQLTEEHKHEWSKFNIFTRWIASSHQTIVLVFDPLKPLRERFPSPILDHPDKDRLIDPFWIHARLLDDLVRLQDTAVWTIRTQIRTAEKGRKASGKPSPDYGLFHDLARHAIHVSETLAVSLKTVASINQHHSVFMAEAEGAKALDRNAFLQVHERLLWYEHMIDSLRLRASSNKERLMNEIQLAFNTVAQYDSGISVQIGRATQSDSAAMKTIAFVTMAFLPATFISAVFSTSFFNYDADADRWSVSGKFWMYWAFAIPVTLATSGLWFVWQKVCPPQLMGDDEQSAKEVVGLLKKSTSDASV